MQETTNARVRTRLHDSIVGLNTTDGGWPYYAGRVSRLEPTCWALLSLATSTDSSAKPRVEAARQFLRRLTRDNGLVVEPGIPGPNYAWNGLALLADISSATAEDSWRRSLVAGLLAVKGMSTDDASSLRQNNRLQAWSWMEDTFSWVEPTALCVLALKRARVSGASARTRIAEAEAMLFDRVCAPGGWNYGNAHVLGQDLRPYVPTTALALLGLQDRRDHTAVKKSVEWLRAHALIERSTMALSLAAMCLQVFGEPARPVLDALSELAGAIEMRPNVHRSAMALCALSPRDTGPAALTLAPS